MMAALLGGLVGLVLGLTGAGGGVLAVPALVMGLGWSLPEAAPVALLAVGAAAGLGSADGLRRGLVRYRAAAVMAMAGVAMAPFGVRVARVLPEIVLVVLFSGVMVIVAYRMYKGTGQKAQAGAAPDRSAVPCRIDVATGRLRWTSKSAGNSPARVEILYGVLY